MADIWITISSDSNFSCCDGSVSFAIAIEEITADCCHDHSQRNVTPRD